ncbi:MAG: TIGR00730 family Rossman fold protein [Brevundimonas sp.]|uniref:LOG family protein n=1 Tax=Brevundimonas sp. TaxID=1871086 RepID=UPI00391FAA04
MSTALDVAPFQGQSVCVFCGASDTAHPVYLQAASELGEGLARAGDRLVYGGGGVGLMGAVARAAHTGGGRVLGVMPAFLRTRERAFDEVETVIVTSMHERKQLMYDQSDVFVVAPGGIGTLEEAIELLSWKRLDLHAKPVIFLNLNGFWNDLLAMIRHNVDEGMTPPSFLYAYDVADSVADTLRQLAATRATLDDDR